MRPFEPPKPFREPTPPSSLLGLPVLCLPSSSPPAQSGPSPPTAYRRPAASRRSPSQRPPHLLRDRFSVPYLAHLAALRDLSAFELRFAEPSDPPSRIVALIPPADLASYDSLLTQVEAQELGEEAVLLACYGANRLVLAGHARKRSSTGIIRTSLRTLEWRPPWPPDPAQRTPPTIPNTSCQRTSLPNRSPSMLDVHPPHQPDPHLARLLHPHRHHRHRSAHRRRPRTNSRGHPPPSSARSTDRRLSRRMRSQHPAGRPQPRGHAERPGVGAGVAG